MICLNSYPRPRHTWNYNPDYIFLKHYSPGSIELWYIWNFNWFLMYQVDYMCLSGLIIMKSLFGAGTLGGMQLAHAPGRGADRVCVCV